MTSTAVLSLHYFPCQDFFKILRTYDRILIEVHEHFRKQSYHNRCYIQAANKVLMLSVPVKSGSQKTEIRKVKIDYQNKWKGVHLRSIRSAYGSAPFFDFLFDELETALDAEPELLFDLNMELLQIMLRFLRVSPKISFTERFVSNYSESSDTENRIDDFRELMHPKKPVLFSHAPYTPLFGTDFKKNLSTVDALFCEGPQAVMLFSDARTDDSEPAYVYSY